jgi:hypothetical protein
MRKPRHETPFAFVLALLWVLHAPAFADSPDDDWLVRHSEAIASSGRIHLHAHSTRVDPALAVQAADALARMEAALGRPFDEATYGPRVKIFVSSSIRVSHVWRGYAHRQDPRPYVFLAPFAAEGALDGSNATYAHELAHLLTWRYSSHSLREGLADYLALQLHPGAAVGPVPANATGRIAPNSFADVLGTTLPAPPAITQDRATRTGYYLASRRFVQYLIAERGMQVFLQLYDAADPEPAYQRLYGADRTVLVERALRPSRKD